jgi:large subunit ribosomal protein L25
MAIIYELNAQPRSTLGKGASRRLRNADSVPAIIYGAGKEPMSLTLSHNELSKALQHESFYSHILTINVNGKPEKAILKALQRHPYKPKILHLDLQRVDATHKIHMHVPVHFTGEDIAPGVKTGHGTLVHHMFDIEVSCLPAKLPEFIEIDVSHMQLGDSIHLSAVKLPEGVQSVLLSHGADHDTVVVHLEAPRVVTEEEETGAPEVPPPPAVEGENPEA